MIVPLLLQVDDALETVLAEARPLPAEQVRLAAAAGRYLAEPVIATIDLPPFTNSGMDGYAVRHADTPGRLEVIGESAAGTPFSGSVGPGQAVTISTGAVLPDGADAVAPIEWIDALDGAGAIEVPRPVPHDFSIRHAGSDVEHGTEVLAAGRRIGPAQIGAAASLGLSWLRCGSLPRVAVLTTGSELRKPGERLSPGQIYDSNGPLLYAALADAGADVTFIPTAADTRDAHREAITQALDHDVVISTGGVSVGGHDLVREIERELGVHELFWRIALKPGKPLSFGVSDRSPAGERSEHAPATLLFGLPGNPVSVLVCFELFVRPALLALQGAHEPRPAFGRARLATHVDRNPERDELIRVRLTTDGRLEPLRGQNSHQLAITALAAGFARIPAGSGTLAAGDEVAYLPLGGAS
ncbi:MAG TPA: gephyrin-like molybdotransferase Glp [Solirubrobacteraceae bacterium]|jgi:molybdopterin molybdotransferase|nr:gephyrin-like molybdotransferase Glp [Solirubrobacteraceae bacterium]